MAIISPSILSADFVNLERDMNVLKTSGAPWAQVDVMDGIFVPNKFATLYREIATGLAAFAMTYW